MADESKDGTSNDQSTTQTTNTETSEDVAGLKSALQAEREARKAADKSLKDVQAQLDKLANAGKSETEKLQAERDDLAKKLDGLTKAQRERDAKDAVRDAAKKAGASDPDVVYRFLRSDLAYDDDGAVTNLDEAIKDAKAVAPQLFRPAPTKADGGNGQTVQASKQGMNDWIRQAAGHG